MKSLIHLHAAKREVDNALREMKKEQANIPFLIIKPCLDEIEDLSDSCLLAIEHVHHIQGNCEE